MTLITIDPLDTDFYPTDVRVTRVALGLNSSAKSWRDTFVNTIRRLRKLRSTVRTSHLDAIVSFGDKTNVLLLLATTGLGVPVIVAEHNDPRKWHMGFAFEALRRLLYRRASAVVALTTEVAEWASQMVPAEAVKVIPNPITENIRLGRRARKTEKRTVVAMGRMGFEKGFDLLLRAFAQCNEENPNWTLRLVGEGSEQDRLRTLTEQLGISQAVRFEPVTKNPEKVFGDSDLFVLSSRTEGFPMVLLEAMASGLPVVSFDCMSGPREMIRNGIDGLLVPPEDVSALAKAMGEMMGDECKRERFGQRALQVRDRFGLAAIMPLWRTVLRTAVDGRNDSARSHYRAH